MTYLQFKQSLDALGIKDDQPVTFAVHGESNPFQWFATTDEFNIDASRMTDLIWRISLIPATATEPPTSSTPPTEASAITPQEKPATGHSQAATAMVWQDIDLAPKDGTHVLGYIPDPFHNDTPATIAVVEWKAMYGGKPVWILSEYDAFSFEPTHFMPLPKAPIVER